MNLDPIDIDPHRPHRVGGESLNIYLTENLNQEYEIS